jgi:NAD(P)-dependent dehydrogenase (short-subunit alcohol dehydrogenase family)
MARKVIILAEDGEAIGRDGAVAYHRRDPVVHCCEVHQCVRKDRAGMDELHGLNVKPVEWTTKFAFEAPTARQRAILSTASAVGFIGQQHHAAYLASKGGYDFAHQGYMATD